MLALVLRHCQNGKIGQTSEDIRSNSKSKETNREAKTEKGEEVYQSEWAEWKNLRDDDRKLALIQNEISSFEFPDRA